jgi:hypothetical protein
MEGRTAVWSERRSRSEGTGDDDDTLCMYYLMQIRASRDPGKQILASPDARVTELHQVILPEENLEHLVPNLSVGIVPEAFLFLVMLSVGRPVHIVDLPSARSHVRRHDLNVLINHHGVEAFRLK